MCWGSGSKGAAAFRRRAQEATPKNGSMLDARTPQLSAPLHVRCSASGLAKRRPCCHKARG
eukprot:6382392-Alexandrium_andersonii.AAC.1